MICPIFQESVRENGSNLELRCSPERSITSSPPMSIEALELENLSMTSSMGRNKKRLATLATFNHPLLDFDATHSLLNNNNNNKNNLKNLAPVVKAKTQPSSRIRYDKLDRFIINFFIRLPLELLPVFFFTVFYSLSI